MRLLHNLSALYINHKMRLSTKKTRQIAHYFSPFFGENALFSNSPKLHSNYAKASL